MPKNVLIKMLGGFHVFADGVVCDDKICKTRKGSMLLQYLILQRGKNVPCLELYEALWPNDESSNPENALKTLVSRTRTLLASISEELPACIATNRGAYCFNALPNCEVDVYEFESLCGELSTMDQITPQTREKFTRLLTIYTGDLLPYGTGETWVVPRSVDLHNRYMKIVSKYIDMLKELCDYDEIIRVTRVALDIDAFDERLHLDLMDALVKSGRNNESLQQYKHAIHMYYRYLGSQPPEGIQEFYKQIITASNELEMNIDIIRKELSEMNGITGAFVCEYAVFKDIYNLQVRSMERLGLTMFIVLLKIDRVDGKFLEPLKMDDVMKRLLRVLCSNLRKGDIITQYSPAQYALLLPTVNYDTCKMVVERIRRAFYREQANSNIMLTYRLGPIGEKGESQPNVTKT